MDKMEIKKKFEDDLDRKRLESNVHLLRKMYRNESASIDTFDPILLYGIEGNRKINEALLELEKYVTENYPDLGK